MGTFLIHVGLQDEICSMRSLLAYGPNSNMSLAGYLEGP